MICLERKILRKPRKRKIVEAPRLLTQLIALRPVAAKGSASHRSGDRRDSSTGLGSGVMSRLPFSRVARMSETLLPGLKRSQLITKDRGI